MFLGLSLFLASCTGAGFSLKEYPSDGFERTLSYQFRAKVYNNQEGQCQRIVVEVKALNKVYLRGAPPERLRLYDDDCMSPVRFEQVKYLSTDEGGLIQVTGMDVTYFWSENFKLENELLEWLWQNNIVS